MSKLPARLSLIAAAIACQLLPVDTAFASERAAIERSAMERIVVTANRTPTQISDLSSTVWVIGEASIREQTDSGKGIKEMLAALVPSMDVSSQGRTNFGQNMRGRAMVVLIDGISMNTSRGISRQLDSIDPFNIARIEVLAGASALYGGGALGGAINIVTKKAAHSPDTFEAEAGFKSGFAGGDDLDYRTAFAVAGGSDALKGRFSAAWQENGQWFDGSGNEVMPDITQTGLQYTQGYDLMANMDWSLSNDTSLGALVQHYRNGSDGEHGLYMGDNFAGVTGDAALLESRKGLDADRSPATERTLLNLSLSEADFFGQTLYLQGFYRKEDLDFHPFPYVSQAKGVYNYSASAQNTAIYGLKAVLESELADSLKLTWGVDWDKESFDSDQMSFDLTAANQSGGLVMRELFSTGRYVDFSVESVAAFVQSSWDINSFLLLNGGYRYQQMENSVDDFIGFNQQVAIASGKAPGADAIQGGSTDYNVGLVNLGLVAKLSDDQQLWLSYSEGFELPDLSKYYGRGSYKADADGYLRLQNSININDTRLDGIKTDSMELGWRYMASAWQAQASAYYAESDKVIEVNSKDLTINVKDQPKRSYGLEAQLNFNISSDWLAGTNLHLVKSEVKNDASWIDETVTYASPSKATAFIAWEANEFKLRLQAEHSFSAESAYRFKTTDGLVSELESYTTLDLLGSVALPVGTLSYGIENLLDEDYSTLWGQRAVYFYSPTYGPEAMFDYHGRGRTFALSYSLGW
ncbi:TonB-dependent receptor [Shewanella sp. JM162201]|uniref:TonB-dependent receptor n=1 Tax=Shewanella jiangmenensis TaxID=2837387 RepID=A0ABS5V619_9GAMM|nr:TonB-dependent receptor [Shewanella jiangmenensis]MBT1445144.1 TonB-dependent receptor [Shewanella jiangmenensis]